MQAYPGKARQYGVAALNRALEGVRGTTAVHICFGYAALVAGRPAKYAFLTKLDRCSVQQISVETAQSGMDRSMLAELGGKTVILGVLDLSTHELETPEIVAARIRRTLPFVRPEHLIVAPDCGMKYLPRHVAYGKMKAMVDGAALVRMEITGAAR
jgi:5-methyltetrahydropteroyltriglutamate--homocysteine methyltransferase